MATTKVTRLQQNDAQSAMTRAEASRLKALKLGHDLLADRFVGQRLSDPVVERFHTNVVHALSGYAAQPLSLLLQNRINAYRKHNWLALFFRPRLLCW
ncbi:hypothetical protein B7767_20310 [Streptomyces sp. 13-12-16]|uniref:hypothetical protein n=1 Tax=Streptomyces sp. 13-12-16 TaxID=1570823 RepID=UPI000A1E169E|nr:hypothetical protein [Streptomyces sp. 13-12-16]OSP41647.1 hypothetical protein B7767_20310 [Streptomyces sp. 13-12-16]